MRARLAGVVLLAGVGLSACGGGGDGGGDGDVGAQVGEAAAESPGSGGSGGSGGDMEGAGDGGTPASSPSTECADPAAPPEIPTDAAPPTTIPGSDPEEIPNGLLSDEMLPQFGALVVDVGPEGCIDVATRFRANQRVQMVTHADDGKYTHIELYAPSGRSIAQWYTGEPDTLEAWDFFNDTPLPADGVYVFRVTHQSGGDEPFMIAFYGDA